MFKSSITIFKISGIPLKLHITFLLILPFLAWIIGNNIEMIAQMTGVSVNSLNLNPYYLGLILSVLLFISVTLHELSHSFVARSKGMEINSITLMLLGGVAEMEEITENSRDEAWMAFSGPLFSLVFGFILIIVANRTANLIIPDVQLIILYLGQLNIFLGIFNLLPAFPTDGGRILRALIASKTNFLTATKIAASIGKSFAFLFGILGVLSGNFILLFIAFFIFIGASQEYQSSLTKSTLAEFNVIDLMTRDVSTVTEDMTVQELFNKMFAERHSGYPVINETGQVKGCVTMGDIKSIPDNKNSQKKIKDIMSTEIIKVKPEDSVQDALKKLALKNVGRLMVMEGEKLVGIITRSDIMKGYRLKLMQKSTNLNGRS